MASSLRIKLALSACMLIMLMALTGCVVSVNIPQDERSAVDSVFAQRADGTVVECVYSDSSGTYDSPTIGGPGDETAVVGHFMSNGVINWVPGFEVEETVGTPPSPTIYDIDVEPTGNSLDKPQEPADSAELYSIEKTDTPFEYKVVYKVYDDQDEPAGKYTHVFACLDPTPDVADLPLLHFYNDDYGDEQVFGDSSYVNDEDGSAGFVIRAVRDASVELYTGEKQPSNLLNTADIEFGALHLPALTITDIDTATEIPILFDPTDFDYSYVVDKSVSQVELAISANTNSQVSLNGELIGNGSLVETVGLDVGSNTIRIKLASDDPLLSGLTTEYKIRLIRGESDRLTSLSIDEAALTPAFDMDTTSYTANVANDVETIFMVAISEDSDSIVNIAGPNGQIGSYISLATGVNTIVVTVTTSDGEGSEVYTIAVTRAAPPAPDNDDKDDKGGSGSSTGTPPTVNTPDPSAGYTPPINQDSGTGYSSAEINAGTFNSLIGSAPRNSDGIRQLQINIPAVGSSGGTILTLPRSGLSMGTHTQDIVVNSTIASVTLPGNMLSPQNGSVADTVSLTVARGDASRISNAEIRALIGSRPLIELGLKAGNTRIDWNNPNAPVTVSIPYVPTAAELQAGEFITVWYIDGAGNAVSVPSGRYDPATGKVTFTVTHFSTYAVVYNRKVFNDLSGYAWAKQSIEVMAAKGILCGTTADVYSPGTPVTRAEFLDSLVKALGLSAAFDTNFKDIPENNRYYQSVGIAKALGITTGEGNDLFNPESSMTRQEMMTFIHKGLLKSDRSYNAAKTAVLDSFTDKSSLAAYAEASAASLVGNGIVTGSNGRLDPLGNTTRAEAAVLMYRLYNMK